MDRTLTKTEQMAPSGRVPGKQKPAAPVLGIRLSGKGYHLTYFKFFNKYRFDVFTFTDGTVFVQAGTTSKCFFLARCKPGNVLARSFSAGRGWKFRHMLGISFGTTLKPLTLISRGGYV